MSRGKSRVTRDRTSSPPEGTRNTYHALRALKLTYPAVFLVLLVLSLIIIRIHFITKRSDWCSTNSKVNILISDNFCINKIS